MADFFKTPIVIIANGAFPLHDYPHDVLLSAGTVICTDGSANYLKSINLEPHVIIGDFDSIKAKESFKGLMIQDPNQNNTDLEKAIEWLIMNSIDEVIILGAMGLREDMAIANLSILSNYFNKINLKIISDYFTIECFVGEKIYDSFPKQQISLYSQYDNCSIVTKNLKYKINGKVQRFSILVSNESTDDQFTISCSEPIIIFRGHKEN